jgi:hypothetical protein
MHRRLGPSIGTLAIGIALVLLPTSMASASQNGGTSNHGTQHKQKHGNTKPKPQTSSQTASFCRSYIAAVNVYESNAGAFTHEDPQLKRMVAYLEKAQAEAPAAVKKFVTQMLKATRAALTAKKPNQINLSGPSEHISRWGNSHCPSTSSGNSGNSGNASNSGNSGNSGTIGNSGNS